MIKRQRNWFVLTWRLEWSICTSPSWKQAQLFLLHSSGDTFVSATDTLFVTCKTLKLNHSRIGHVNRANTLLMLLFFFSSGSSTGSDIATVGASASRLRGVCLREFVWLDPRNVVEEIVDLHLPVMPPIASEAKCLTSTSVSLFNLSSAGFTCVSMTLGSR